MNAPREDVYQALFEMVSGVLDFRTRGRKLIHWSQVDRDLHPAVYTAQNSEEAVRNASGVPTHWRLHVDLWLYVWTRAETVLASTLLNQAIDRLDTALSPRFPGAVIDLGFKDVVRNVFIEGTIRTDEGTLGERGVACVPVVVVVA